MRKFTKSKKGFTLVELLIVVVILGILAAVAIPRFLTTRDEAQLRTCQSQLAAINGAVDEWAFMNPGVAVPADLAGITDNDARFPDGIPVCPTDGLAYNISGVPATDGADRALCVTHGSIKFPIVP
jgi:prepilin-type N-terminal cleavage/methylation domain-containing protein